jgi:signal transduction histidine kinase
MFLKHLLKFPKTLGFKVSAWYSTFFIVCSLFLFLITYFFIINTLKNQDHEEVLLELNEIYAIYERNGITAVERFLTEGSNINRTKPLFVRIADDQNVALRLFPPNQWDEFDLSPLEKRNFDHNEKWIQIPATNKNYILDITSALSSDGTILQVGMSSEGREKVLGRFREIFIVIMILLFTMGLIGGVFLSYLTLQPIRKVIKTVSAVKIGKITANLPRSMTGDEVDELTVLFNEMLENINQLIINMKNSLDNVAHDLRTPMTRLRNIAESALLEDDNKELLISALETNVKESAHILNILDTIMDIAEAKTGVMEIDHRLVNISILIEQIADMYQLVADEKEIQIQSCIIEHDEVMIDSTRIGQVLANIIDNAIKFTPPRGTISIETAEKNCKLLIKISDTGIGICDEELPFIWDRLYRGDQSRSSKGLGLGLSAAKGIAQAHNGRIEVESKLGVGSTFTLILPI